MDPENIACGANRQNLSKTYPSAVLLVRGSSPSIRLSIGAAPLGPLIYGRDGNNYLIVASKGGAPDHPGWYKNLLAHPDVKIQVWDKVIPVRARTATAEEKKRVWPIMTAQWPDYDTYQAGTKRDIPVILLTPR